MDNTELVEKIDKMLAEVSMPRKPTDEVRNIMSHFRQEVSAEGQPKEVAVRSNEKTKSED